MSQALYLCHCQFEARDTLIGTPSQIQSHMDAVDLLLASEVADVFIRTRMPDKKEKFSPPVAVPLVMIRARTGEAADDDRVKTNVWLVSERHCGLLSCGWA